MDLTQYELTFECFILEFKLKVQNLSVPRSLNRERKVCQVMLRQMDIHMQKNEAGTTDC